MSVDGSPGAGIAKLGEDATLDDSRADAVSDLTRIWRNSADVPRCGSYRIDEDFSTGSFKAHRFRTTLAATDPGDSYTVRFVSTAGAWQPAVVLVDGNGATIYDGSSSMWHSSLGVVEGAGHGGSSVELEVVVASAAIVNVYVTSVGSLESDFAESIDRSAEYELTITHGCTGDDGGGGGVVANGAELLATCAGQSSCDVASVWTSPLESRRCRGRSRPENFSTGSYNVHAVTTTLSEETPESSYVVTFEPGAGSIRPVLVIADTLGALVYDGRSDQGHYGGTAEALSTGASGGLAEVRLDPWTTVDLVVFVPSWEVLDSGLTASVPASVSYDLSIGHDCPGVEVEGLAAHYEGLSHGGYSVPTSRSWDSDYDYDGMSFVQGRISEFGGPSDRGVSSTETGALCGNRLRRLGSSSYLSTFEDEAADMGVEVYGYSYYFAAMRWDYNGNAGRAKRFLCEETRLLVVNPDNGRAVVLRLEDWGPGSSTGRIIDVSPQAMDDLGVTTDEDVIVAFASPDAPLGFVD